MGSTAGWPGFESGRRGSTRLPFANDDEFVSAIQHATQIAVRTHQAEKLEALRNAVLNVAAGTAPGDDLQMILTLSMPSRRCPKTTISDTTNI